MKKTKKLWMIVGVITCILLIVGFLIFNNMNNRPQNLGPSLEYIGESEYGCWMPWVCSAAPGARYFFTTDLTDTEIKNYFKGATYNPHENRSGGGNDLYNFEDLYFKPNNSGTEFTILYYDNTQAVIDYFKLRQTDKKSIVSISSHYYPTAKKAYYEN